MGNNDSKKPKNNAEEKNLDQLFSAVANNKGFITRNDLKKAWESNVDPNLYKRLESFLFGDKDKLNNLRFKKIYSEIMKGDLDQRVEGLARLIYEEEEIPYSEMVQFVTSIINTYLIIENKKSSKQIISWSNRSSKNMKADSLIQYGNYFISQTRKDKNAVYGKDDMRVLLGSMDLLLAIVFNHLYQLTDGSLSTQLFPKWKYTRLDADKQLEQFSCLDLVQIIFLNMELPVDFQAEWRLLFSTELDGESFSRLSGGILNKGASIVIIKDAGGNIFGGFAPQSWTLSPNFAGDSSSFLFTLSPEMSVYSSSHFNENYQYINTGQQTMPNGLGMGGKLGYYGLWLDAEFGTGYCSESCTTYKGYKMMSSTKHFHVAHVEVWGVGSPPPTAAELGERSVLDTDFEAKAILEMAGKTAYSDGLREVED